VETAVHVPVGEVSRYAATLRTTSPVLTMCEAGYRSSLAASLLTRAGVPNVVNVTGGMTEYRQAAERTA
jgi:hydroxyacylglutathione hydrolase